VRMEIKTNSRGHLQHLETCINEKRHGRDTNNELGTRGKGFFGFDPIRVHGPLEHEPAAAGDGEVEDDSKFGFAVTTAEYHDSGVKGNHAAFIHSIMTVPLPI